MIATALLTTMAQHSAYNFSFTAASLRPELAGKIAEYYFRSGSWEEAKRAVLTANALQARSPASSVRMERELRQRLQTLTPEQLRLLPDSTADVRTCVAWLASVKHSAFLYEFPSELLRAKLELHDQVLRESDYERFISEKTPLHPELSQLTATSSAKIRRVLLRMLREVGLLSKGPGLGTIQHYIVPPAVERVIRADDPKWLAVFLYPDAEIAKIRAPRP